jgi:hypothetical protein
MGISLFHHALDFSHGDDRNFPHEEEKEGKE